MLHIVVILGWLALNACVAVGVAVVSERLLYGTGAAPKGAMTVVRLPFPTRARTVLWSMGPGWYWYSIWIAYLSPRCRSPPSMWAMRPTSGWDLCRHLDPRIARVLLMAGLLDGAILSDAVTATAHGTRLADRLVASSLGTQEQRPPTPAGASCTKWVSSA